MSDLLLFRGQLLDHLWRDGATAKASLVRGDSVLVAHADRSAK